MDTTQRKRSYSELKITGPPLYGQGNVVPPSAPPPHSENSGAASASEFSTVSSSSSLKDLGLDAQRTALLVVDVQPEYWSECPAVRQDFPDFPLRMQQLLGICRKEELPILWVRADYNYEKSPWLIQFSRLHQGRIPPVVQPSSRWEDFATPMFKSSSKNSDETVLTKSSWSSTSNTDLLLNLKQRGIDTVLVCGLITSVCVQHSAFGVFEAGYRTILVTDACADRGRARHEAALALYGDYMYELATVESIQATMKRSPQGYSAKKQRCETGRTKSLTTLSTSSSQSLVTDDDEEREPSTIPREEFEESPIQF